MKKLILLCLTLILVVTAQSQIKNTTIIPTTGFLFNNQGITNTRSKVVKQVSSASQVSKIINVSTAGTLNSLLSSSDKATVTDLTISGQLDARDFAILRDSLPLLKMLDIGDVNIQAYSGSAGTINGQSVSCPANEIPIYAFCNQNVETPNTTLMSIVFPLTATSIGEGAFALCQGFISTTIPASITNIGNMAFVGFSGDMKVDSNNTNYSDLNGVLMDKSQQRIIQYPSSKTGNYTIMPGIKTIALYSFYGCNLLKNISIPSSVNSIESYAFFNCIGLTSITVNNRPEKIVMGSSCFYNVNSIACVLNVPFGTQSLFRSTNEWSGFSNIVESAHGFIVGPTSMILSTKSQDSKVLILTNDAWTVNVNQTWATLNKAAGTGNDSIVISTTENNSTDNRTVQVTFSVIGFEPQTVFITQSGLPKTINSTAGGLSALLTKAELDSTISLKINGTIDARDFKTMRDNMPKLIFLDMSGAVVASYSGPLGTISGTASYPPNSIPGNAFNVGYSSQNLSLASVTLPSTIKSIGSYAFYSCDALTSIVIPNSVTFIGSYAFGSCNLLNSVTLPSALTSIEANTFIGAPFSEITIPNTVTKIGIQSFASCRNLKNITIPNSVVTIDAMAFQDCAGLLNLNLGNSVTSIGGAAFRNCSGLSTVTIPNSVTLLDDYSFADCTNIDNLTLGNGITTLGASCFQDCPKLSTVSIPNSVTKIETYAFVSCTGLTNVTLGNSVTTIESYAFSNCTGLKSFTVNADKPVDLSSVYGVFASINNSTCVLNVPFGTKNLYAVAVQWKDFANIIENNLGFALESNFVRIATADGSKTTVKITSNNPWTVSSNQSWLKVDPVSTSGNNTLTLTADANLLLSTRTATVTVSALGVSSKTITVVQAAAPKIVSITAGGLAKALTATELSTLSSLTINGTINSRDFKIMRDSMPQLAYVDISAATILAYNGSLGTIYYNYANTIPDYAFCSQSSYTGKAGLISIILPLNATAIGSSSFQSCSGLTYVSIPNSMTSIGYGAFSNCIELKNITLSPLMTKIQSTTFKACSKLKNFVIPNSIQTIEYSAFESCIGLDSISIPNTVTTLGTSVFASCSQLKMVTLPNALTKIDGGTFSGCSSLQTITIPNSVTSIEYNAFLNCSKLETVNFGTGLKYFGYNVFESCSSLNNITIPASVTSLGSDLFKNCTSLTNVSLPNSLTTCGSEVFYGCTALKELTLPTSLTKIESNAFYNCTALTKVNFGKSVKLIDYAAFSNCTALTTFAIPNSVNTLGSRVFASCTALSSISLGDSLVTMGDGALGGCKSLRNLVLPSTLKTIGSSVFSSCTGLTELTIPNSVTTLGASACNACSELVKFTNSNAVTRVESYSFQNCGKLSIVNLGNSVTDLGDQVFENCNTLTNITLPETLKTIGNLAFHNCSSLSGIIIPNSVISIAPYAFWLCSGMTNLVLGNSLTIIDSSVFNSCSGLTSVVIPNSVTSIGYNSFQSCSGLNSISIGNSVVFIGGSAFNGCNKLISITIPGSVNVIGFSAFDSCTGLKSIYANPFIPVDISSIPNVFNNVDKINCTLYVPYKTKSLYSSASQWKDFTNIVENPYGLRLDTDSLNLSVKEGSSATINVTSNTNWTAASNQTWLTVTPNQGTGSNTISLTAEANPLLTTRKAIVTVQASSIEPQYVIVTQDAATKTVTVSAGGLNSGLTQNEHTILKRLTISGTLDATDFKFIRDSIPYLQYLDITQTSITAYNGANGTGGSYTISYPAATIPQYAFYNSYSSNHNMTLKSVLLPNSITSIGNAAFEYCYQLDSITIPNTVNSLADFAFSSCTNLKKITLSNTLQTIGRVFENCYSLVNVDIPNSVTALTGTSFASCTSLKNVSFGNSLLTIGDYSFYYCSSLINVNIPAPVKTIGNYAFYYCTGLNSISIPASVMNIGYYAFENCNSLIAINAYPKTPVDVSSSGDVFSNVNKTTCILYVPKNSKSLYQAAYQWKDFLNIIEMTTGLSIIEQNAITIYPNPVAEKFRINGLNEVANLLITDINGRLVFSKQINISEDVVVDKLAKGIYIARIITNDFSIERKLVKR